ncbi:MAG TPA: hypothetical protein VFQ63_02365 [Patescibacteria group bacterium]|nr:hypothetical protein [Patescibacteria group bacterium]
MSETIQPSLEPTPHQKRVRQIFSALSLYVQPQTVPENASAHSILQAHQQRQLGLSQLFGLYREEYSAGTELELQLDEMRQSGKTITQWQEEMVDYFKERIKQDSLGVITGWEIPTYQIIYNIDPLAQFQDANTPVDDLSENDILGAFGIQQSSPSQSVTFDAVEAKLLQTAHEIHEIAQSVQTDKKFSQGREEELIEVVATLQTSSDDDTLNAERLRALAILGVFFFQDGLAKGSTIEDVVRKMQNDPEFFSGAFSHYSGTIPSRRRQPKNQTPQ